jgi:hypothetical protein
MGVIWPVLKTITQASDTLFVFNKLAGEQVIDFPLITWVTCI